MLVVPELKPGYAELPIVATSSRTYIKPHVQATPAVGLLSVKTSLHHKASFLLFIKNKQK